MSLNKYAWRGTSAVIAAMLALAMFMVTAQMASADVDAVTIDDALIAPGGSTTVTVELSGLPNPADGASATYEDVSVFTTTVTGSPDVAFAVANDDALTCDITITDDDDTPDADDTTIATGETVDIECDGQDVADADITHGAAGVVVFDLTLEADADSNAGTYNVTASDVAEGGTTVTSTNAQVGGDPVAGDADSFEISAPTAVEPGQEFTVTVTVLDDDGDPVLNEDVNVEAEGADAEAATVETDGDGEAVFTFEVDDDASGVVLTFYTGTGSIVNDDVVEIVTIIVPGDAESINVEAPATVEAGATGTVTATVVDADQGPVPNADIDFIASAGSIVGCDATTDSSGEAECTYVAPLDPQSVQITVVSAGAVGTATVQVTGETDPTDPTPGEASISDVPAPGNFGLATGGGTFAELSAIAAAEGCPNVTFWVTPPAGGLLPYVSGVAVPAVNAPAMAAFPNGVPAGSALLIDCD